MTNHIGYAIIPTVKFSCFTKLFHLTIIFEDEIMTERKTADADERARILRLLDCYGGLLTQKQQRTASLYFAEDLSLGEISDLLGISRQGVMDSLHSSLRQLHEADMKLGFEQREKELLARLSAVRALLEPLSLPDDIRRKLNDTIGDGYGI